MKFSLYAFVFVVIINNLQAAATGGPARPLLANFIRKARAELRVIEGTLQLLDVTPQGNLERLFCLLNEATVHESTSDLVDGWKTINIVHQKSLLRFVALKSPSGDPYYQSRPPYRLNGELAHYNELADRARDILLTRKIDVAKNLQTARSLLAVLSQKSEKPDRLVE